MTTRRKSPYTQEYGVFARDRVRFYPISYHLLGEPTVRARRLRFRRMPACELEDQPVGWKTRVWAVTMAPMPPFGSLPDRVLLHVTPLRRIVVVPDHVYLLEADRDDTIVRKRGRRTIRDVRPLGKVVLQPPVNRVLPVSRARLPGLLSRVADKV